MGPKCLRGQCTSRGEPGEGGSWVKRGGCHNGERFTESGGESGGEGKEDDGKENGGRHECRPFPEYCGGWAMVTESTL